MTSGDHPPDAPFLRHRAVWLTALGIGAVLLGVQSLAASTSRTGDVLLLLPSEGLLAGVGDGLRRGVGLAMAESRACGYRSPTLQLGWLPPGQDPRPVLQGRPHPRLLIAPPAVSLLPYGELAKTLELSVILPLQRASSVQRLPGQTGSDRLWPILPARSLVADRLAKGVIDQRRSKVLVIHDGGGEQAALADRFIETVSGAGGWVVGPDQDPQAIAEPTKAALKQLQDDVDWFKPEALVVMTDPGSPLAKAVSETLWPADLTLVWPFPVETATLNPQFGVDPLSRGPGWEGFEKAFQGRYGYAPGLVEAAGYDAGQLAALAAVSTSGRDRQQGWDLGWLDPKGTPKELCAALKSRRQAERLVPKGAASRLDLSPGVTPTADLRLTTVKPGEQESAP